jgi:hypothetical protein
MCIWRPSTAAATCSCTFPCALSVVPSWSLPPRGKSGTPPPSSPSSRSCALTTATSRRTQARPGNQADAGGVEPAVVSVHLRVPAGGDCMCRLSAQLPQPRAGPVPGRRGVARLLRVLHRCDHRRHRAALPGDRVDRAASDHQPDVWVRRRARGRGRCQGRVLMWAGMRVVPGS